MAVEITPIIKSIIQAVMKKSQHTNLAVMDIRNIRTFDYGM